MERIFSSQFVYQLQKRVIVLFQRTDKQTMTRWKKLSVWISIRKPCYKINKTQRPLASYENEINLGWSWRIKSGGPTCSLVASVNDSGGGLPAGIRTRSSLAERIVIGDPSGRSWHWRTGRPRWRWVWI